LTMFKMNIDKKPLFEINSKLLVCLVLVIVILALYWPLSHNDFINYDDNLYVSENHQVSSGLTVKGMLWSFQTTYFCNWHPLTWLSHMADVELYGLNAGRHHLTNVLFHIANTVLLFILLKAMTGAVWPSAFVAALFALHPLHVESVAWVSERKDLLSTFLGILTLISYAQYTQQRRRSWYGLALLFFILGLMAKPMLVTLPFLLLLLDYWPLGRLNISKGFRLQPAGGVSSVYSLILEKLPFFVLTTASCVVTYYAQQSGGAMVPFDMHPMGLRVANAIVAYVGYIGKMLWPVNLAIFYPLSDSFTFWKVAAAAALLLSISLGVLVQIRRRPYLAVGWFWYVGTLVPVIGLVQVGGQAMADRYTYIPLIGLFIMIAWWGADSFRGWKYKRIFLSCTAGMAVIALMILTNSQIRHWANSVALFEHTVKATGGTWVAYNNLANALNDAGKTDEALRHYEIALQKGPPEPEGIYNNMALVLASVGRNREAIEHYSEALRINPNYADAHINLGAVLARQGKIAEATRHYFEALRAKPNFAQAHYNMGNFLLAQGEIDAAVSRYSKAVHFNPSFAESYNGLGLALMQTGKLEEAVFYFRKATNVRPSFRDGQRNLKLAESIYDRIYQAVSGMRGALRFDLETPDLNIKMIELLEKKKKLEETLNQFQKTLSLQPGFTEFDQNNIAIVLEVKRKYEQKLELFRRISEVRPDSAEANYHIACIYARKRQAQQSISWLNQAIEKGFNRWELIETDSDLNLIRDSENFQSKVKG
jgi:tetratricopeptide (TPR) repeat protein